jgi:hypothetical protein
MSADGSRVFFEAPVSNGGVPTASSSLYVRDDHGTVDPSDDTTAKINTSERTVPVSPKGAVYLDASKDGSRVFFSSTEALTDDAPTDGSAKLYMYDLSKPDSDPHNLTFISADNEPADGSNELVGLIGAGEDGRSAYFIAEGQLVAGEPTEPGSTYRIFLWQDNGAQHILRYVAPLALGNSLDTIGDTNDYPLNGSASWRLQRKVSRVTPDGRYVLFASHSGEGLTGYDQQSKCLTAFGACQELYVYNADTGAVACASCNPSGAPATSDATNTVRVSTGASPTSEYLDRAISDDGRYVFFTTGDALVSLDHNGQPDAYVYDTQSEKVSLLSSGASDQGSYFLDASASGKDAFFVTPDQLVGWDRDSNYDLYDARVGGGFPEPVVPAACGGDQCQGVSSPPPVFMGPGSVSFTGPGNLPAPLAKPRAGGLTNTQKLNKALRVCRKQKGRQRRRRCEVQARKRYAKTASKSKNRGV